MPRKAQIPSHTLKYPKTSYRNANFYDRAACIFQTKCLFWTNIQKSLLTRSPGPIQVSEIIWAYLHPEHFHSKSEHVHTKAFTQIRILFDNILGLSVQNLEFVPRIPQLRAQVSTFVWKVFPLGSDS